MKVARALALMALFAATALLSGTQGGPAQAALPRLVPDAGVDALAAAGGQVYVGGEFSRFARRSGHFALVRRSGGAVQRTAEIEGDNVYAIAGDGRGGWFVGGDFQSVAGTDCRYLAHVHRDGSLDRRWCPRPNAGVRALARAGRTLYAGGFFTSIGGKRRPLVAALDTGTRAVRRWDAAASGAAVHALAVSRGTVYLAGDFERVGGRRREDLAAVGASTGHVTAWNPHVHAAATTGVDAIAVSGATVFVGGSFSAVGGRARSNLAALDVRTAAPTRWRADADRPVDAIAVSGRRVYVGGEFRLVGGRARSHLAALDARSGRAAAWNPGANAGVWALAVGRSTVYAGGAFDALGRRPRRGLAAIDARSGRVTGWNPGPSDVVYALAAGSRGRVAVGGGFTSIGRGLPRPCLARLDVATEAPAAWVPALRCRLGGVDAVAVAGPVVYAAGDGIYDASGTRRTGLAAVAAATGRRTSWNPTIDALGWCTGGCALAVAGSKVFVGGTFAAVDGHERRGLAALDAATGAVTPWDAGLDDGVAALVVSGSTLYVGGFFAHAGDATRPFLAALDLGTGSTTAWNPRPDGPVRALAVVGSTVFLGGDFTHVGGQARNHLAAVDARTGRVESWNPNADDRIFALAPSAASVYVGGVIDRVGGAVRHRLAAVDSTSGAARAWRAQLPGDGVVEALAIAGSRLVVGGYFDGGLAFLPLAR